MEVVGEGLAAPPYPYIIETGLLERKVLSWIRLFKSQSFTIPSAKPVAKKSLYLLNLTPPLTGIYLLWYALNMWSF